MLFVDSLQLVSWMQWGGGSSLKAQPPAGARAAGHGAASARGQIRFPALTVDILPFSVGLPPGSPAGRAADASYQPDAPARDSFGLSSDSAGDWLNLSAAASDSTESPIADERQPAKPPGGGAAMAPRGGSGALATGRGSIQPLRVPPPTQNAGSASPAASAAASSALLSALGLGAAGASSGAAAPAGAAPTVTRNAAAVTLSGGAAPAKGGVDSPGTGTTTPGGVVNDSSSSLSPPTSPAFELATVDYNDGSLMVPGFDQLATPGGSVDLRAQVRDSATGTYTFSWDTSGLTDATSISGASTYDLTFQWNTSIATANAESATLTVTDPNSDQVSQTYTFWVPAGTGSATGGATWNNQTLDPGLIQAGAPVVRQPERLRRRAHRRARDLDRLALV